MNTKIFYLIFVMGILLASCVPQTSAPTQPPQETEAPIASQEPAPTEPPTEAPIACVTLLSPLNNADILPVGKATFTWTPIDGADSYALNIILPSGEIVTFGTDKATHDRYMEAFTAGGTYQWYLTALGADGSEICISKAFAFEKPAFQNQGSDGGGDSGGSNNSGGESPSGPPGDFDD